MHITLSSKGQIVLPAPMRRRLRLKTRAKLEIEERDGGLFIRPVKSGTSVEPIAYAPPGSLKVTERMIAHDQLFSEESV